MRKVVMLACVGSHKTPLLQPKGFTRVAVKGLGERDELWFQSEGTSCQLLEGDQSLPFLSPFTLEKIAGGVNATSVELLSEAD